MFETASGRIEDAKKQIAIMKETGEKIRPLPFGTENNTLFVSSDENLLIAFDVVEVEDIMYFIGFKKQ